MPSSLPSHCIDIQICPRWTETSNNDYFNSQSRPTILSISLEICNRRRPFSIINERYSFSCAYDRNDLYMMDVLLAPSLPLSLIVLSMFAIIKYLPRYAFVTLRESSVCMIYGYMS